MTDPKTNPITPEMCERLWPGDKASLIPKVYSDLPTFDAWSARKEQERRIYMTEMG